MSHSHYLYKMSRAGGALLIVAQALRLRETPFGFGVRESESFTLLRW